MEHDSESKRDVDPPDGASARVSDVDGSFEGGDGDRDPVSSEEKSNEASARKRIVPDAPEVLRYCEETTDALDVFRDAPRSLLEDSRESPSEDEDEDPYRVSKPECGKKVVLPDLSASYGDAIGENCQYFLVGLRPMQWILQKMKEPRPAASPPRLIEICTDGVPKTPPKKCECCCDFLRDARVQLRPQNPALLRADGSVDLRNLKPGTGWTIAFFAKLFGNVDSATVKFQIVGEDGRYVWTRFHFLSVTRRCLRTEVSKDGQFFDVQIAVPPGLSQEDIEEDRLGRRVVSLLLMAQIVSPKLQYNTSAIVPVCFTVFDYDAPGQPKSLKRSDGIRPWLPRHVKMITKKFLEERETDVEPGPFRLGVPHLEMECGGEPTWVLETDVLKFAPGDPRVKFFRVVNNSVFPFSVYVGFEEYGRTSSGLLIRPTSFVVPAKSRSSPISVDVSGLKPPDQKWKRSIVFDVDIEGAGHVGFLKIEVDKRVLDLSSSSSSYETESSSDDDDLPAPERRLPMTVMEESCFFNLGTVTVGQKVVQSVTFSNDNDVGVFWTVSFEEFLTPKATPMDVKCDVASGFLLPGYMRTVEFTFEPSLPLCYSLKWAIKSYGRPLKPCPTGRRSSCTHEPQCPPVEEPVETYLWFVGLGTSKVLKKPELPEDLGSFSVDSARRFFFTSNVTLETGSISADDSFEEGNLLTVDDKDVDFGAVESIDGFVWTKVKVLNFSDEDYKMEFPVPALPFVLGKTVESIPKKEFATILLGISVPSAPGPHSSVYRFGRAGETPCVALRLSALVLV